MSNPLHSHNPLNYDVLLSGVSLLRPTLRLTNLFRFVSFRRTQERKRFKYYKIPKFLWFCKFFLFPRIRSRLESRITSEKTNQPYLWWPERWRRRGIRRRRGRWQRRWTAHTSSWFKGIHWRRGWESGSTFRAICLRWEVINGQSTSTLTARIPRITQATFRFSLPSQAMPQMLGHSLSSRFSIRVAKESTRFTPILIVCLRAVPIRSSIRVACGTLSMSFSFCFLVLSWICIKAQGNFNVQLKGCSSAKLYEIHYKTAVSYEKCPMFILFALTTLATKSRCFWAKHYHGCISLFCFFMWLEKSFMCSDPSCCLRLSQLVVWCFVRPVTVSVRVVAVVVRFLILIYL